MMFFFLRKQLTTYYFYEKLLSQIFDMVLNTEAVAQKGFVKKVFLQISENSQEKTCNSVSSRHTLLPGTGVFL